jgi:hypothetical protein
MSTLTEPAPAVVHDMWIWLADNAWKSINLDDLNDMPTPDVIDEIRYTYPGGVDGFFQDHATVTA